MILEANKAATILNSANLALIKAPVKPMYAALSYVNEIINKYCIA